MNPLFEIMEIKCMRILYFPLSEPLVEVGEVVSYLLAIENTVDHVAAKQS